tara:strand:- start:695 stop:1045 length:351 start_codon:yes stop_codon:yes gene_type:complete
MKQPITAFIGLFEEKLKRLKHDLKDELKLAKSDRRKEVMKRLVTEAKGLQKTIKSVKPDESKKDRNACWVCGGELIWGGDHDLDKEDYPEYNIVSNLTCSSCESFVEVYHKRPEDE